MSAHSPEPRVPELRTRAHAKLNLCLAVGPPEPPDAQRPGWHPIASWMCCIDLHDEIAITAHRTGSSGRERGVLSTSWADDAPRPSPIDWPTEKDLCARALRTAERLAGAPLPVTIETLKRIPAAGGLGGGSSDAGAVLLALIDMFSLDIQRDRLIDAALALGSDVPFFTDSSGPDGAPRHAVVSGFGERIERMASPERSGGKSGGAGGGHEGVWATMIVPAFGCDTARVYREFDAQPAATLRDRAVRDTALSCARGNGIDAPRLFNDLAEPAMRIEPRLRTLTLWVSDLLQRPVHVSGSGSTLFSLGATREQAEDDARAITRHPRARDETGPIRAVAARLLL